MYRRGIALAVLAGVCSQLGHVLNKLEVNRDAGLAWPGGPRGRGFYARLLRRPLWVLGIVLQIGVGTVFFLLAQVHVGPALTPGLMATGLVVLVLGSAWIVRETPKPRELAGMSLLVVSAFAFGRSRLRIDLAAYHVLGAAFLRRSALFSLAACGLLAALLLPSRSSSRRGSLLALASGLLYVLSNFWVGPFVAVVLPLLGASEQGGRPVLPLLAMFIFASAVLVLTNLFGIALLQRAFQHSSAASAVPLQMIPTQVGPVAVYLLVFRLPSPAPESLPLFALAMSLVIGGSCLLAGRGASGTRGRL